MSTPILAFACSVVGAALFRRAFMQGKATLLGFVGLMLLNFGVALAVLEVLR